MVNLSKEPSQQLTQQDLLMSALERMEHRVMMLIVKEVAH